MAEMASAEPTPQKVDLLSAYSRALDEIYERTVAALYEAHAIDGLLAYSTLPPDVRVQLEAMQARLRAVSLAQVQAAYQHIDPDLRQRLMRDGAGSPGLTRSQWEDTNG